MLCHFASILMTLVIDASKHFWGVGGQGTEGYLASFCAQINYVHAV
jgi:hypothetical protein